jgi:hypothetical protein
MLSPIVFALLTAAAALGGVSAVSAAGAKLRITCTAPSHEVISCRLAGAGFRAHEHLAITYRVEYTALPLVHGQYPTRVFRRNGQTDGAGAFLRPPLRFAVVKNHESYRVTTTVIGKQGDRVSSTAVGIAQ